MLGARSLGQDALGVLNVSHHARRSPLLTSLFSVAAAGLLYFFRRRPRGVRRRAVLLPLLFRLATSTFVRTAAKQLLHVKRSGLI